MRLGLLPLLLAVSLSSNFGIQAASTNEFLASEAVTNGVHLQVYLPKKLSLGETGTVSIIFTNGSERTVYWNHVNGYIEFNLNLIDRQGKPCPRTDYGRLVLGTSDPAALGFLSISSIITPLRPGQTETRTFDLAKCFVLSQGSYRLSISMEFDRFLWPFQLKLQNVRLEIEH